MKVKLFAAFLLTVSLWSLTACNTVKGLGEDFEALGESMQRAGD